MRKLASIVRVDSVTPVENSDRLDVVTMEGLGWRVVVGRGEFAVGDLAVYAEIDAFLPADDKRYEFLKERCLKRFVTKSGNVVREGIRIKTIKLRGQVSQGLIMPIKDFPEVSHVETKTETVQDMGVPSTRTTETLVMNDGFSVGSDITELLKVEHYDEVKESLAAVTGSNPISADAYGKFPSDFIPKTDEDRIQADTSIIERLKDRHFEVSVKADGQSVTFFYAPSVDAENPFGVCSRNLRLKPKTEKGGVPLQWQMADSYKIESALKEFTATKGHEIAIQCEMVGPGIQKCRNKETNHTIKVFRIWDITDQKFMSPNERRLFCKEFGIPHVEIVAEDMQVFHEYPTVDAILKFAEGKTAEGNEREGLVFKTCDDGEFRSFKAVSNRYLMKQED